MVRARVSFVLAVVVCLCTALNSAKAQVTVVQRSGPQTSGYVIASNQVLGTTWSQSGAFTGVSVFATIGLGPDTGYAYLTNRVGPGTTAAANEIASGPFLFPTASTET